MLDHDRAAQVDRRRDVLPPDQAIRHRRDLAGAGRGGQCAARQARRLAARLRRRHRGRARAHVAIRRRHGAEAVNPLSAPAVATPIEAAERAPLLERLAHSQRGPELTVIVPTRNERDNIIPLYNRLCATLGARNWEMMVVDDDSADGTARCRALARRPRPPRPPDQPHRPARPGRRPISKARRPAPRPTSPSSTPTCSTTRRCCRACTTCWRSSPSISRSAAATSTTAASATGTKGRARISALATRLGRKAAYTSRSTIR